MARTPNTLEFEAFLRAQGLIPKNASNVQFLISSDNPFMIRCDLILDAVDVTAVSRAFQNYAKVLAVPLPTATVAKVSDITAPSAETVVVGLRKKKRPLKGAYKGD